MSDTDSGRNAESPLHDPDKCFCLFDSCTCKCEKCQAYRDRELTCVRLVELHNRLLGMGLDPVDLAELIFIYFQEAVAKHIQRTAKELSADYVKSLIEREDVAAKLLDVLFDDIVKIATGVYDGVKRNGRRHHGKSRETSGTT